MTSQPHQNQPPYVPGPTRPFTAPPQYGPPPPGYQQPFVPPPKKPSNVRAIAIVAASLVGIVVFAAAMSVLQRNDSGTPKTGELGTQSTTTVAGQDAATPEKATATAKTSDFTLTPKITSKQCFGSAGCNVEYQVHVDYSGPALDESDTWVITYEATGDESGPITNQLEVTGTQVSRQTQLISTPSSGTKIKIKVTDVEKQ